MEILWNRGSLAVHGGYKNNENPRRTDTVDYEMNKQKIPKEMY